MPRPTNKTELLTLSQKNFDLLIHFVENLSEDDQMKEFPAGTMNRSNRDVLAHLYHWQLMMKNWYEVGVAGQKPETQL